MACKNEALFSRSEVAEVFIVPEKKVRLREKVAQFS